MNAAFMLLGRAGEREEWVHLARQESMHLWVRNRGVPLAPGPGCFLEKRNKHEKFQVDT